MRDPRRDRPVWYRSLYWRIALGFILCVGAVLLAQAALFLWLASRTNPLLVRSPQDFATLAAVDLAAALEADRALDLDRHLRQEYSRGRHPLILVMADGRVLRSREVDVPPMLVRQIRAQLVREARGGIGPGPDAGEPDAPGAGDPRPPDAGAPGGPPADGMRRPFDGPPGGIRLRLPRRPPLGRIVVGGELTGFTLVLPGEPAGNPVLNEYGPSLAVAALGLLLVGTGTMAFFVFRPARRRLRALEAAAAAVGAGDTAVRAPEGGGDEVAALARGFNRMATDLEARVGELRDADRSRRQLLADVSHELMTPLTAMRGYLETLALPQAVPDAATRERYLRIVTAETRRLEAIIGDLLELARLESGGGDLRRDPVEVAHLFARCAERHESALAEKRLALDRTVEPGADLVAGDERRLEQVVQNLVANAVRHTPPGGRIALAARPADGRVALSVSDTGPGIAPEHLARVFDRFYRVEAARDQQSGGSGLGLSIVRAIVEQHGGTIAAANAPGGGARFELRLDRGQAVGRSGG